MQMGRNGDDGRAPSHLEDGAMSRRSFLKMVGAAGVAAGWGIGLGGVAAGCGDDDEAVTSVTALVETVDATDPEGTDVGVGPETGRDIVIGLVSPETGHLALFGRADDWCVDLAMTAMPEGIIGGDGRRHRVVIRRADSRSDPAHASRAAEDLLAGGRVDLMTASGASEVVDPVAALCEALGCPAVFNLVPWQPILGPDAERDRPSAWTYLQALDFERMAANYIAMWDQVATNKKVGLLLSGETQGLPGSGLSAVLPVAAEAAGYALVVSVIPPASGEAGTAGEDFSAHIADFQRNGCEICCGVIGVQELVGFWSQSAREGYNPKVLTVRERLLFPQTLALIGDGAYNSTTECVWHPSWPFRDSIGGMTCSELAEDFVAKTGEQWIAPVGQYAKFEWMADVFSRVGDLEDKYDVVGRIGSTRLNTSLGWIDFTAPVREGTRRPRENVYLSPLGGQQWTRGDLFPFEPVLVSNALSPELRPAAAVRPMSYDE